jgi:hypothetical protein
MKHSGATFTCISFKQRMESLAYSFCFCVAHVCRAVQSHSVAHWTKTIVHVKFKHWWNNIMRNKEVKWNLISFLMITFKWIYKYSCKSSWYSLQSLFFWFVVHFFCLGTLYRDRIYINAGCNAASRHVYRRNSLFTTSFAAASSIFCTLKDFRLMKNVVISAACSLCFLQCVYTAGCNEENYVWDR